MEFGLGNGFETVWALRQVSVSFDPRVAVQMRNIAAIVLIALITDAHLGSEVDIVWRATGLDERVIKLISIEGRDHCGAIWLDKTSEALKNLFLWWFIEDSNMTWEFLLRRVVKFFDFMAAESAVDNQEGLTFIHQWNHHDLILFGVWELQRILWCFDIIWQNFQVRHWFFRWVWLYVNDKLIIYHQIKPFTASDACIDTDSTMVWHIVLPDSCDKIRNVLKIFDIFLGIKWQKIVVIFLLFFTFIDNLFDGVLSVVQVLNCSET